jgi:cysteine synthase A
MTTSPPDILHRIGGTPLLPLRRIVPASGARLLLKLESENPTGSMKDRMALAMIEAAEADGRLAAGGSVVEYTGGSTGVSLALVCAVKGLRLHIVTSDAFAREKLDHMRALGAELQILPSDGGRMTGKLTRDMIEAARIVAEETGAFWTDQMQNADQLAAYHAMAEEIWEGTAGRIDVFVQSVGTAASLRGIAEGLRRRDPAIRISAVEPAESPVLSGGPPGAHRIDGIGAGFVVPLWRDGLADAIERVSTEEATAMALRLAREEGLFAGTSTGANVVAALRVAERAGAGATIVTVMCDTGMKYLSAYRAARPPQPRLGVDPREAPQLPPAPTDAPGPRPRCRRAGPAPSAHAARGRSRRCRV